MKKIKKSSSLKEDFAQRSLWVNYRSSAVFPFFIGEHEDTILVFQNYWLWKSNIKNIIANIYIRDSSGTLASSESIDIKSHNEISIKKLIYGGIKINSGTIEIELIANKNLGYPLPAILCFFKSKSFLSVVHSAGRILNANETHEISSWKESNFLAILDNKLSPFISIFNGQHVLKNKNLELKFFKLPNKKLILRKKVILNINSFGSQMIYIKNILKDSEVKLLKNQRFYIEFEHQNNGIFGRYVVGNYYKKENMHFTTHSFMSISRGGDIIESKPGSPITSFLSAFNKKPLALKIVSYPTNLNANVVFKAKESNLGEVISEDNDNIYSYNSSKSSFEEKILDNKFLQFYSTGKVPGRLNISYNFSLGNSIHPTDIATGFRGHVFPSKTNHWGSIVNASNWKTVFFISNCSHNPKNTKPGSASFSFFDNNRSFKKKVYIPAETCITFEINKDTSFKKFISWRCKTSIGNIELFWVSYNKKNGAICGDHSF